MNYYTFESKTKPTIAKYSRPVDLSIEICLVEHDEKQINTKLIVAQVSGIMNLVDA